MARVRKTKQGITTAQEEIYQRFMDWLRQTWWGLPDSDYLMPLIKTHYTPEEASLLTGMPFSGKNLEELAEMKQMNPDELRKQLDRLAKKGLVFRTVRGDTVRYSLNDFFFIGRTAFWPGHTDTLSKTLAPLHNQHYYHGGFEPFRHTETKGLRVLPIQEAIEDSRQILPYEEVVKVLDSIEYFSVSHCPCRHRKNLDPNFQNCTYPTEVCLHFDRLGQYIVENGMGREITRKEAEEILRHCAEIGLVHGISNQIERPDTICNCCKCCCIFLEAYHKLGHSMSLTPSNYRIHTNPQTCIGCGLCVKRCPMEALHLEDLPEAKGRITIVAEGKELKNKTGRVTVANTDLCIGCGVCVYKCPTGSLKLQQHEPIQHPPQTGRHWVMKFTSEVQTAKAQR